MAVDLLHLWRSLRRSPASAGAAILTLALTLGAGTSIGAVVQAVLLTPPPFADPDALVLLGESSADAPAGPQRVVLHTTFTAWRERAGSLAVLEAIDGTNLTLTELGAAERVTVNDVSPGFLRLLGIAPALGRAFEPEDTAGRVIILSDRFWRAKLAADPAAIGRPIVLGGLAHTVVGVLPPWFNYELNPADVWRPLPVTPAEAARVGYQVGVLARLAPGLTSESLRTSLEAVSRVATPPARVVATPVVAAITRGAAPLLGLLLGAAALATLIAFANVGGLLTLRSLDRRSELAVRRALGAGRFEIARQLLLEALALVLIGTAVGAVLALWTTPLVAGVALEQFGGVAHREVAVSWPLLAVVAAAAAACAFICALLPASLAERGIAWHALRRAATPRPRERLLQRLFVIGEIGLAFVLLACVTLLGGSLLRLLTVNPGFDPAGVLVLQVSVPAASYDARRASSFYAELQHALEARLGPGTVAVVNEIPLTHDRGRARIGVRPGDLGHEAVVREASPQYFEVMRIPIVAGRGFDERDNESSPPRVVISQALARALFEHDPPVGRRVWLASATQIAEVLGVVGDVPHRALDAAVTPTVYRSARQEASRSSILVVRSTRPESDAIATVRAEVTRLDRDLPVYGVRPMLEVIAASPGMPARRVLTATFTAFAALALVLGAVGLFGLIAHDVASRRIELALRIALGADPARIIWTTVGHGAVTLASGLSLGALLSLWAVRALGVSGLAAEPFGVLGFAPAAMALVLAAAGAIVPVALRAARTDPLIVLRSE